MKKMLLGMLFAALSTLALAQTPATLGFNATFTGKPTVRKVSPVVTTFTYSTADLVERVTVTDFKAGTDAKAIIAAEYSRLQALSNGQAEGEEGRVNELPAAVFGYLEGNSAATELVVVKGTRSYTAYVKAINRTDATTAAIHAFEESFNVIK